MTELRVYLLIESLRRQFAAYLASPTRGRGYVPLEGTHSLIIEIVPALAIHRVIDLALKSVPEAEPGLLYVERQFGILELHDSDLSRLGKAGQAVLDGIGARAGDQLRPQVLYTDIVDDVTDQHAVLLNRSREASMVLPSECLLLAEMAPALFAGAAANEAERAAPDATLVDCQMIGASGRLFMSGRRSDMELARQGILAALGDIEGRQGRLERLTRPECQLPTNSGQDQGGHLMSYELVLKGGRLIDPSQNLDRVADIAFAGGKVAKVGAGIQVDGDADVRDVSGLIVTPGLIDLHTHVYWGGTSLSIDAEDFCRTSGVTTAVDRQRRPRQLAGLPQTRHRAQPSAHPRLSARLVRRHLRLRP